MIWSRPCLPLDGKKVTARPHEAGDAMNDFLSLTNRILTVLAGLLGAAGVAGSAIAAHGGYGETLNTASLFALIHAALVMALTRGVPTRLSTLAGALVMAGALLFCGDLALRDMAQRALFPMAAPLGGFLMIGGWLVSTLSGAFRRQ